MTLKSVRDSFRAGLLPKPEYIIEMHKLHSALYDYSDFLKGTDIAKIEISDQGVVMTSRNMGVKMICDPLDRRVAPIEILNFDAYEEKDAQMMAALVDEGNVVYDVGANFGWYSICLGKQVKNLKIYAFEPVPRTFDYLTRNIELNQSKNIRPFKFGFSNKAEEKTFYFYPEGSGNASLSNLSERKDVQEIRCEVKLLDDFAATEGTGVDFIKCDVEGAELFVFQGALKTLEKHKPVIFTELLRKWSAKFGYHPNQLIGLLSELGYRCFTSTGRTLKSFHKMDEATEETNFFFLHEKQHAEKICKFAP